MTRYPRQVDREYLSCRSGRLDEVQMIDGGTLDLHQDLVARNRRGRYIAPHQRPTVFQQSDSFHARSPCVSNFSEGAQGSLSKRNAERLISPASNCPSSSATLIPCDVRSIMDSLVSALIGLRGGVTSRGAS